MKVLLVGYYGKGNFGDDVLLKVTHGIVRQWLPEAEISILCDQYKEDYIPALIGEKHRIIQPGSRECFDLIIHGGGGTFFDFDQGSFLDLVINKIINLVGFSNYAVLDHFVREWFGKQRLLAKKRLGWGVGVGTYSKSSKKLKHHLPTLLSFDFMTVRDSESLKNLEFFKVNDKAILGSDIAFLSNYWLNPSIVTNQNQKKSRPKLGVVLRDWPFDSNARHFESFVQMLPQLNADYELSVFVFDRRCDTFWLEASKQYSIYVWDPPKSNFDDFCDLLSEQDVFVTSRAHGAICGAVLGSPSVLIEIEPKLRTVHEMLPQSTTLFSPKESSLEKLIYSIENLLRCGEHCVSMEVQNNRLLAERAVSRMLKTNG